MTNHPQISVVMSVYNNVNTLSAALESVLTQAGVELECIVIDDGSTDGSGEILDDVAANATRVKVIHKQNEGLTRALIEGCALASAPWIARQDADDISLPGRLRTQLDRTYKQDAPVLVTCSAMWRTPDGVDMFPSLAASDPVKLRERILKEGKSIYAHGTALFSRMAYQAVGGYRSEYYYAQDPDLFIRLAKFGPVAAVRDILYAYTFSPYSISTHSASTQQRFRELILRSDDQGIKDAAELSRQIRDGSIQKEKPFSGFYFIGSCLRKKHPYLAAQYYVRAWRIRPWSLRTLYNLIILGWSLIKSGRISD